MVDAQNVESPPYTPREEFFTSTNPEIALVINRVYQKIETNFSPPDSFRISLGLSFLVDQMDSFRKILTVPSLPESLGLSEEEKKIWEGLSRERQEYFLPTTNDLCREVVANLDQIESPEDFEQAVKYHNLAFEALANIISYLAMESKPKDHPLNLDFKINELDFLTSSYAKFPQTPATFNILMTHWLARTMYRQKNVSVEARNAWLNLFYDRVIAKDIYGKNAEVYADVTGLEPERYANALLSLHKDGLLPDHPIALSCGCGSSLRVEKPAYDRLATENPLALPGELIGVDMFDQPDDPVWKAGEYLSTKTGFFQERIEDLLLRKPEFQGKFDLIVLIGSPLNNMDLITMQQIYFYVLSTCLKPGGILLLETGVMEPTAKHNDRLTRSAQFLELFSKPPGSLPINPAYAASEDNPDTTGAFIYPLPVLVELSRQAGLALISPRAGPGLFNSLKTTLQDPKQLIENTDKNRDPLTQPFYVANAPDPDTVTDETLLNVRGCFIFQKTRDPRPSSLLAPFLRELTRKHVPSIGQTAS